MDEIKFLKEKELEDMIKVIQRRINKLENDEK